MRKDFVHSVECRCLERCSQHTPSWRVIVNGLLILVFAMAGLLSALLLVLYLLARVLPR